MNILPLKIAKFYGNEISGLRSIFVANHKSLETGFWNCSLMCSRHTHPRTETAARQRVTMGHYEDMNIIRPQCH